MKISFFIPGQPKGAPRHRARAIKRKNIDKWYAKAYPDDSADDWKARVALSAKRFRPAKPVEGPVRVNLVVIMPRPKYMLARKYPDSRIPCHAKPDRDNADKLILDELTRLGFWRDDCQVWDGRITKYYQARYDDPPGAYITIETVEEVSV